MRLQTKNKKGISIMIGYVLLITFAVVISLIVYQQLKTYLPQENVECEDGVSIFIQDIKCYADGSNFTLNLTLKNNGRFAIGGYFIRGANDPDKLNIFMDLSDYLAEDELGVLQGGNLIRFVGDDDNPFYPDNPAITTSFEVPWEIYNLELIPLRYLTFENRKKIVSCSNAVISEKVNCQN